MTLLAKRRKERHAPKETRMKFAPIPFLVTTVIVAIAVAIAQARREGLGHLEFEYLFSHDTVDLPVILWDIPRPVPLPE
jgi:hypothetical protein